MAIGHAPFHLPDWLGRLTAKNMLDEPFPFREVLDGALYYPACGNDGRPVQYLGQRFHSFIYVDYGYDREMFIDELVTRPFLKYQLLGMRSISISELTPNGWGQPLLSEMESEQATRYADHRARKPFCEWMILEREVSAPSNFGPERFSLLYLNADGAAVLTPTEN